MQFHVDQILFKLKLQRIYTLFLLYQYQGLLVMEGLQIHLLDNFVIPTLDCPVERLLVYYLLFFLLEVDQMDYLLQYLFSLA